MTPCSQLRGSTLRRGQLPCLNIYTPKAQQGREGVAHPKRRPASDWKRQRATTKTGARSLVTTSSTSSCGWNVDGARDVGAEPGPVFLSEAAREGAAEPASVVALEAGALGSWWSFSMVGRPRGGGWRKREREVFEARVQKERRA